MHVNIRNAYLCADCDAIGDSPEQCPACASRLGILPLITVLNRTQKATMISKQLDYVEARGIDGELLWSGYATNRQADAEAIVRILHQTKERIDYEAGLCLLCLNREDNGHEENYPFQMADEFIAKYGTHPPKEPRRA